MRCEPDAGSHSDKSRTESTSLSTLQISDDVNVCKVIFILIYQSSTIVAYRDLVLEEVIAVFIFKFTVIVITYVTINACCAVFSFCLISMFLTCWQCLL